jgi:hypothetical protein
MGECEPRTHVLGYVSVALWAPEICSPSYIAGCPTHSCVWNEWEPVDVEAIPATFRVRKTWVG